MKKFTKMMLSAYPRMPHLLKSMDEVIEESAVRSFYDRSASYKQAEKLLYRLNKRDCLARIYGFMANGINRLGGEERQVLSDRLTGKCRAYQKERYSFSRTTYYRRLRRAVKKIETFLYENDVESIFRGARLDRTAYFRFLEEALNGVKAGETANGEKTEEALSAQDVRVEAGTEKGLPRALSGEKQPTVGWKLPPLPLVTAGER